MATAQYGPHPSQTLDWTPGEGPLAVLIHGGFWRTPYERSLMVPMARDLAANGWAVANLDYRRIGEGDGWSDTFGDVSLGVFAATALAPQRPLVLIGHSAGGHLALWAAGEAPRPAVVVSLAGVADLVGAARDDLGRGAARELLGGGPDEVPERYAGASPLARLPLGVPTVLVHGDADEVVPVAQSVRYAEVAAAAGDLVTLLHLPGVDHDQVIDPKHASWAACRDQVARLLPDRGSGAAT